MRRILNTLAQFLNIRSIYVAEMWSIQMPFAVATLGELVPVPCQFVFTGL